MRNIFLSFAIGLAVFGCQPSNQSTNMETETATTGKVYDTFKLTTDLSQLSESEKQMIPLLIEAAKIMDGLFWKVAFGEDKDGFLANIADPAQKELALINYGPWDRLGGDSVFIPGFGPKPDGAQFYPADMTKEEFESANLPDKASLYTLLKRDAAGKLATVPYHVAFEQELKQAAALLEQAAALAEDPGLKNYLTLRAKALITSEYYESDMAWMDMKSNGVDIVIGPIETYEDKLFGYKAAFEAYVLVKDKVWSERLSHYTQLLPALQKSLPVPDAYKQESPGTDSDLNAYDAVYYAGDCNAGSKTIAINLPNDERIQNSKGTRRLQLKNAMQAKFDKIMTPIAGLLIDESQRANVTFPAFFGNTMFHEVAHGLGIKNTVGKPGTVREALLEQHSPLEEAKADILGLYMVSQLFAMGEPIEGKEVDYYVTFLAGIFRSVRFGASSAHGKANMMKFNYFREQGAFAYDAAKGTYKVDFEKMKAAVNSLSALILQLQGDGNYEGVKQLMAEKGLVSSDLQTDLDRLAKAGIPVDIVFEQGAEALGL